MKNILDKYKYILVIIVVIIVISIYIFNNEKLDTYKEERLETEENLINKDVTKEVEENYYIDIKGEVINPGVYKVPSDSRIIDVISIAGGLTNNADTSLLNLSKRVVDEMNIRIYSKKEVNDAINEIKRKPEIIEIIKEIEKECVCPTENNSACINEDVNNSNASDIQISNDLININTATLDELMNISGIGKTKALSIIEYRKDNVFTKIEDIKNVSGIGESTFESIKNNITV